MLGSICAGGQPCDSAGWYGSGFLPCGTVYCVCIFTGWGQAAPSLTLLSSLVWMVLGYDASVHWSLWTYVDATLPTASATRFADKNHSIRLWLEGATLHLFVLLLGTELRYWLYDGNIFIHEYSLVEATLNTLLWGALSVTYAVATVIYSTFIRQTTVGFCCIRQA